MLYDAMHRPYGISRPNVSQFRSLNRRKDELHEGQNRRFDRIRGSLIGEMFGRAGGESSCVQYRTGAEAAARFF